MRWVVLFFIVIIWLRIVVAIVVPEWSLSNTLMNPLEGFDSNFKRVIPIDIDGGTITVPKNIKNNINIQGSTSMKNVNAPAVVSKNATLRGPFRVDSINIGSSAISYSNNVNITQDTTIYGDVTMPSLTTVSMTRDGWVIRTDGHLHMRRGGGTQIATDGNIHMDNRGWTADLLSNAQYNRNDKVQIARRILEALAAAAAREAQRLKDEAEREAQKRLNEAANAVKSVSKWRPF